MEIIACPTCDLIVMGTVVCISGETADAIECDECQTIIDYIFED